MATLTKTFVPGEGPLSAKICFIGEAPGERENREGRPFVGPSGELLSTLLRTCGILRSDCYITNVIKEQPPYNEISTFIDLSKKVPKLTEKYKLYEEMLYKELRACAANVFVPLGNVALYALTRQTAIMKRRGSILSATQLDGRKVIPTIHPSAALREYKLRYPIAHDLQRIAAQSAFPEVRLPQRHIAIAPSFSDAIAYVESCNYISSVGVDIEVVNLQVSCIAFAKTPFDIMCIPFVGPNGDFYTPEQEAELWKRIGLLLENPLVSKVGQNFKFDTGFLHHRYGIKTKNIEDTMIAQAILWPDLPKGLDFIASVYTEEPYYKDEGKKYMKVGGSFETFWIYNAKDAAVTIESWPKLEADLIRQQNHETYVRQRNLIEALIFMEEFGIRVDVDGLRKASEDAGAEIERLTKEFQTLCGYAINPGSAAQLKDYFYVRRKIKPYLNRKTGAPTTDANALKRLARAGMPCAAEASTLQKIRKLTKMRGTYFNVTLDEDQRLRCSFNPVGTWTGRLSSSENIFDVGTNVQNLPPAMKKFLLADEGYVMYNVDLSQAENRAVAYIAPEPNMIHAFESGIDIHCQTAGMIFGKATAEISDAEGSSTIGDGTMSERAWGKRANHALNYDLGYKKFAFMYEIPEKESHFIVEQYHRAYPGVRQYHAWVRNQLIENGTLITPYGRRRKFLDRPDDELYKAAYAFIPQSTIADHLNQKGLAHLYNEQELFKRVVLLNQVHDSVVFQIPLSVPWTEHARILLALRANLMTPIVWRTTSFIIPADCTMGLDLSCKCYSPEKKKDVPNVVPWHSCSTIEALAAELEHAYARLLVEKPSKSLAEEALEADAEDVLAPVSDEGAE